MEDVIPTIILIAGVFFLARWMFRSKTPSTSAPSNSIRGVSRLMVDTISSAFPDIPPPNIVYSLSRTRSAQATSEELLERGYLPAPPASFRIPPSLLPPSFTAPVTNISAKPSIKPVQSLIERYGLATRVPSIKGKEKEVPLQPFSTDAEAEVPRAAPVTNGRSPEGKWEDTKEKREIGLKERKEKMILEARQRLLDKQAKLEAGKA